MESCTVSYLPVMERGKGEFSGCVTASMASRDGGSSPACPELSHWCGMSGGIGKIPAKSDAGQGNGGSSLILQTQGFPP